MRSVSPVCLLALAALPAILAAADPEPPGVRLPAGARPTLYELELTVVPTESTFTAEVRVHLELAARHDPAVAERDRAHASSARA